MLENELPLALKRDCLKNNIPFPDLVVQSDDIDLGVCTSKDFSQKYPALSKQNGRYTPGCYLWIDEGILELPMLYLYAGKAALIKNRLLQHWCGSGVFHSRSSWLDSYWDYVDTHIGYGIPLVYVWLTEERASLESRIIQAFAPMFNTRKE